MLHEPRAVPFGFGQPYTGKATGKDALIHWGNSPTKALCRELGIFVSSSAYALLSDRVIYAWADVTCPICTMLLARHPEAPSRVTLTEGDRQDVMLWVRNNSTVVENPDAEDTGETFSFPDVSDV